MKVVRRWYIYLVSAISLLVIAWGLITLLQELLPPGPRGDLLDITVLLATLIVGVPFFLGHAWWGERLFRGDPEEQRSAVRRFYIYATSAILLFVIFLMLNSLLRSLFSYPYANRPADNRHSIADSLISLPVLILLLAAYRLLLRRDARQAPERDDLADIRRWYVYAFSTVGLFATAVTTIDFLQDVLVNRERNTAVFYDWRESALQALAVLVAALPLWLYFWRRAQRLFTSGPVEEQESALRKVYLYAAVFLGALLTVGSATMILEGGLRRLLDVRVGGDVREGLTVILVMGLVWLFHGLALRQDMRAVAEAPRQAAVRRLYLYLVAGIGLGAFLIGLAGIINVFFQWVEVRAGLPTPLRRELASFLGALIAGLPVWAVPWLQLERTAHRSDPAQGVSARIDERRSLVRRIYLYFYLFVSTLTVLGTAIYIVSQLLYLALGGRTRTGLVGDIAQALAFGLIGAVVWIYHSMVLRGDGRFADQVEGRQLADFHVLVVDTDPDAVSPVMTALEGKLPAASLHRLAWPPAGVGDETVPAAGAPPALLPALAEADLIVGPWTMLAPEAAAPGTDPSLAAAVVASPAPKLLLPLGHNGWHWAGLGRPTPNALARQVVRAVEQAAAGEEIGAGRSLTLGTAIGLVLAGLVALPIVIMVVVALISFMFNTFS